MDSAQIDRLEDAAPVALEAAGEIADAHAENEPRIERAAPGDDPPPEPPVRGAAARDVARAEREVGSSCAGGDQPRRVLGIVREVAVHLEDQLRSVCEGPLEAREIRGAEALLALAMEHGNEVELGRQPVGDLTGSIGRVVVDHEHAHAKRREGAEHRLDVLALVVGREADGCRGHEIAGYGKSPKIGLVAALPGNADVADQFDLLADLLELEGAESFRVLAYRRAATRMRETSGSVAQLALDGRAKELQGIGKTIEEKIVQIVEQGKIEALQKRESAIPPEVVLFMRLPGLGPKTAARIWKELGVSTLEELKTAAETERLRTLPGLGAKSEEKILKALAFQAENPDTGRRLLGDGLPAVQAVVALLREHPAAVHVSEAGSVRRRKETFRDLDIIATATDPTELTAFFTQLPWVVEVVAHGDTKATVLSNDGLRFDLRVVPPESYGNLLQHFTGSKDHNVALREDAVRRGLSISEYGVTTVETGDVFKTEDEDALYEFLGYQPIPPELRESSGELEAARRHELPELVRLSDVRGDLHTHTHWSADGKNTLAEMVAAASERGYEYYAITDHSHYLREGRLAQQLEEIEQMRERYPKLRILAGVEANIRSNGEVDVAEEELARLDWVVASVHNAPENRPTERVLEAMQNPYVDCIGHLTGRRISKRGPRDVSVERVIEGALEAGCFLEINGQPDRLDLRDVHARAAKEAGLKLLVNSDAHQIRAQNYVEFGIGQARRGWLTKDDVLNTRAWAQFDKLRRKRP